MSLHSPRPKFLSILLSVDRLGKNVAQEEYIGWSENCCLRYETRGENSSFSWATAVIHVDDDITNLHPLWNEQLKGWPSRLSVTPLEKNVVLPIGHANVLASRPRIHRDPRLDQLV